MTNGVLPNPSNNLQVQTGTGMNVIINPGFAICNGCLKLEETQRTMAVQASNDTYDRIDTVVLRLNDNDSVRECDFYVLQGVPATSPIRPELTQTDSIWEIGLADLFISKNSTVISADKITDTRYETARCGIISAIAEFDTTTIYNQIQADLADFKKEEQADILAWFEDIKGQLSGDVAVNLQNQIGALSLLNTNAKSDLVSAMNEINSKEVAVLDSGEEILANTETNKAAGAKGVKELFNEVSDSLVGFQKIPDYTKIIAQSENFPNWKTTPITYTAMEDCFFNLASKATAINQLITLNGLRIAQFGSASEGLWCVNTHLIYLPKGSTITIENGECYWTVFRPL